MKRKGEWLYEYAREAYDAMFGRGDPKALLMDRRFEGIPGGYAVFVDGLVEDQVSKEPTVEVGLQGMTITHAECIRVGAQCALGLLQSAVDGLLNTDGITIDSLRRSLLLICLRELRNVVVHQSSLDVATRHHQFYLVSLRDYEVKGRLRVEGEWFLCIDPLDVQQRRSCLTEEQAVWFAEVCEKNPIGHLFKAAVIELLSCYINSNGESVVANISQMRPFPQVLFRTRMHDEGL